jgi:hypothetical protein
MTWLIGIAAILWVSLIFALDSRDVWKARAQRKEGK